MKKNCILTLVVIFASSLILFLANPPTRTLGMDGQAGGANHVTGRSIPSAAGEGELFIRLAVGSFDPLSGVTPSSLPSNLTLSGYPGDGLGYYLVQFNGPITPADKQALIAAGAGLFDYIPDFTFIVKMDQVTGAAVKANPRVRWVGLYQPAYRVEPALLQRYRNGTPATVELIAVIFKGEDPADLAAQVARLGGNVLEIAQSEWKSKLRVTMTVAQLPALAAISGVKWIEAAPQWQLFNNEAATIMGVREVWDTHGLRGAGQIIAVADTGLDQGSTEPANLHDDFEDGSGNTRVGQIFDWVEDGGNDTSGHGTHVAGSAVGNGLHSGAQPISHTYPVSAYTGIAPEAGLVFQAVGNNSTGSLQGIPVDLTTLFAQAETAGATLHTNSWGSAANLGSYSSMAEDVDEYVWNHPEFTILFAAGNQGVDSNNDGVINLDSITPPGTAKNAITVGATENSRLTGGYNPGGLCENWGSCFGAKYQINPINGDRVSDNPNGMAAFSGRGPTDDGRFKPDLVAPGTNIASTRSSQASSDGWGAINVHYRYLGGTSMSTPLVAGAAALVREFYQAQQGMTPSAALIKATLLNGAIDIAPGQYGTGPTQEVPAPPRPNQVSGWGRINLENSLFPTAPRVLAYDDERTGIITEGSATYVYTVTTAAQPLTVTLTWSDYPGTPVAGGGLVNDLDLIVTAPNDSLLTGIDAPDHVNNVEGFDLSNATLGVYTITVQGYNVPQEPQPYALVVVGAGSLNKVSLSKPSTLYLPVLIKSEP